MTTRPEDVPVDLVETFWENCDLVGQEFDLEEGGIREGLAAVLPLTYKYWFEQALGTAEEIRARGAEAANRPVDDPAELIERVRPGWRAGLEREARVKELRAVAAEMDASDAIWVTADWLLERAEEIAQGGTPEDVAVGCQRATTEVEDG